MTAGTNQDRRSATGCLIELVSGRVAMNIEPRVVVPACDKPINRSFGSVSGFPERGLQGGQCRCGHWTGVDLA